MIVVANSWSIKTPYNFVLVRRMMTCRAEVKQVQGDLILHMHYIFLKAEITVEKIKKGRKFCPFNRVI